MQNKKPRISSTGARRSAYAARGAVFARLEDPSRRALHNGVEEIEQQLEMAKQQQQYRGGGYCQ